jgi:hypothetical protein
MLLREALQRSYPPYGAGATDPDDLAEAMADAYEALTGHTLPRKD